MSNSDSVLPMTRQRWPREVIVEDKINFLIEKVEDSLIKGDVDSVDVSEVDTKILEEDKDVRGEVSCPLEGQESKEQ